MGKTGGMEARRTGATTGCGEWWNAKTPRWEGVEWLRATPPLPAPAPQDYRFQTTAYLYDAKHKRGSKVGSHDLVSTVKYPGRASELKVDQEKTTYDALGEVITTTDRNGTVHTYTYDNVGRQTVDTSPFHVLPVIPDGLPGSLVTPPEHVSVSNVPWNVLKDAVIPKPAKPPYGPGASGKLPK